MSNDKWKMIRLLQKAVDVKASEVRALCLGFIYYFLIFSSYYVIRPIRDDIGAANGIDKLPWLFTGTMIAMLFANALFAALVVKFSRRRFIPIAYRFLIANLLIFFGLLLMLSKDHQVWVGRAFFVWTSVFNLFVVSVFWAFMVDVFSTEQGKRLFGFISVGGTLGAIVGAAITATLVQKIGSLNLLLISAVLLELGAQCVRLFPTTFESSASPKKKDAGEVPIGGSVWAGIIHNLKSPYLLGICGYMFLYATTSTLLYFQQVDIAAHAFADRAARTAFFAKIDLVVNVLAILGQTFLAARLIKWLGVGVTLALLPAMSVIGFSVLGVGPTLVLLVVFLTLRRATDFALARPARETLFTVVSREDKYKAKNLIDTLVYRGGDQFGAWSTNVMRRMGLGLAQVSLIAAPIAAIWLFVTLWLGRRQARIAREAETATATPIGK